jgi:tryptophan synthase beta chain
MSANVPDDAGRFGEFGGRYVPEAVMPALIELERAWDSARADPTFTAELNDLLREAAGRPTPLYRAERFS